MVQDNESELIRLGMTDPQLSIRLVRILSGKFQMGSTNSLPFALEEPVHEVTISYPFSVGQFLVTQQEYSAVTGINPSRGTDHDNLPVENVTWSGAKYFCEKLSAMTGRRVRLPSESEWEYVCRAGSTTEYFFGDSPQDLGQYAWYEENSQGRAMLVELKKPNPWGLYDLVGNVWEWCEDVWHSSYDGAPQDGSAWRENLASQGRRCVRGGAANMDAFRCRSSYRSYDWHDAARNLLGFRIVVSDE